MDNRLLSAREVSVATHRRQETVLAWLQSGELPAMRSGGRWYVHPADLEQFLRDRARAEAEARRESSNEVVAG